MAHRKTNGHMSICNTFKGHDNPSSPYHRAEARGERMCVTTQAAYGEKKCTQRPLGFGQQLRKNKEQRGAVVNEASARSQLDSVGTWQVADRPARMCEPPMG